jgi:hypothetical protein
MPLHFPEQFMSIGVRLGMYLYIRISTNLVYTIQGHFKAALDHTLRTFKQKS